MKGAGDLCVKLGLDTPGEEVGHCKVCTRSTTRTVCDGGGRDYSCTSAEKTCVCVCFRHSTQNVTVGRVSSKQTPWQLLKRYSKSNTPPSSLCLRLTPRLLLSVKRSALEGGRKRTEPPSTRPLKCLQRLKPLRQPEPSVTQSVRWRGDGSMCTHTYSRCLRCGNVLIVPSFLSPESAERAGCHRRTVAVRRT